ncbi:MAG: ABC transporter permease [Thermoflexia bacterium]|nr:MAG: ABC transporter permease [Thermoflexia bacterium]
MGFVVVGGAMTAFWLNVLWSMSSQLYWEKESGNLALYIMAPNSMMAILLGMALGGIIATSLRAAAILIVGSLIFHVQYSVGSVPVLVAVFLLTLAALYGLGMMTASLFLLWGREAWHLANLAQEPIYLLSGFYFPVKNLGFWVAAVASIIPLTLGLDAMRQLLFPSGATLGFLSVSVEVTILALLTVLFIATARWLLSYVERIAIREGRLLEYRR